MFTSETILLSSLLYLEGFLPENHFSLLKATMQQKQKGDVKTDLKNNVTAFVKVSLTM